MKRLSVQGRAGGTEAGRGLRWYVEEFSQRSGTEVDLVCSTSFGRFSSEVETAIFIVQECLGNIHRHSQSPTAAIHLEVRDGWARLVVSDRGRGISEEKQQELKSGVRIGWDCAACVSALRNWAGNFRWSPLAEGQS